jgi:DNA-binding NarL/FixJ family response regulator
LRVLVADDQEEVRRGICSLIDAAPELEVCGEASNGEEAVEKTVELHPDLVILDITMPVMNGLDAAKMIRTCSPGTPILIVSIHEIRALIEEARHIGVDGYVAKSQVSEILIDAIRKVIRHQKFFPPSDGKQQLH